MTSDKEVRIEALERVRAGTRMDSEHKQRALGRLLDSKELNRYRVTVCLQSLQGPNVKVIIDDPTRGPCPLRVRLGAATTSSQIDQDAGPPAQ